MPKTARTRFFDQPVEQYNGKRDPQINITIMHPDGKTSAGCFFYGLGQHKPAEKDSGIHNNRMVKERAHNMSVQQGMNCACAAASGTVVSGQIVQDTAIRREYPQEITAFPCKSEYECENKTYPANDIKRKI